MLHPPQISPPREGNELGLLHVHAAVGLGVSTAKASFAERGQVHDAGFLTDYARWLNSRDLTA